MRWYADKTEKPRVRVRTWFAFFPVTVHDETRWLEKVTVKQEYFHLLGGPELPQWHNMEFIDGK